MVTVGDDGSVGDDGHCMHVTGQLMTPVTGPLMTSPLTP